MKPGSSDVRDLPVSTQKSIVRYSDGIAETMADTVVTEYALTVYVNDQEMATVVCTPDHLDDLVIGFLASEGVIRALHQVMDLTIHLHSGIARVKTETAVNFNQEFYNKRYIASCCGKGRQSFYFQNDAHLAKPIEDETVIQPDEILTLVDTMESEAALFQETGGVHVASLCDTRGIIATRTDIGRHNALDKLYGHALRNSQPLTGTVITFSGRLSSEVLLKVAKIGVPIVLAKSAPTALAIDIAEELNITAIGFVRSGAFNVYSHPWRVRMS